MERREFEDHRGRRWTGSVTSGTDRGGEERAEIIFVCRDQPDELKRVGHLEVPPRRADDHWRELSEDGVRDVFLGSEPA